MVRWGVFVAGSLALGIWFAWEVLHSSELVEMEILSFAREIPAPSWWEFIGIDTVFYGLGAAAAGGIIAVLVGGATVLVVRLFKLSITPFWAVTWTALIGFFGFAFYGDVDLLSSHVGKQTSPAVSTYVFSSPECDLAATFPGPPPSYRTQHHPEGISIAEATWRAEHTMLRAECTDYDGLWHAQGADARNEDWVGWMREFMNSQGIHSDSLTSERVRLSGRIVHVTEGRGSKIVGNDTQTTYGVKLVASSSSIIILYVANPSRTYPSKAASRFLENVHWHSR